MRKSTLVVPVIILAVWGGISFGDFATFNKAAYHDELGLKKMTADLDANFVKVAAGSEVALAAAKVFVGNASGVATAQTLAGDVTIATNGTTSIGSGVIIDADVGASAAIAHTKLAAVAPAYMFVGNAASQAVARAVSGDATITTNGVISLGGGTLSTNTVIDTVNTNVIVLRTLPSGIIVLQSWTVNP